MLSRDRAFGWRLLIIAVIACALAVCIAAANLWPGEYPQDSFWTLSTSGRIGVVAISSIGIGLVFALLAWKTRRILRIKAQISATAWTLFDIAIGVVLFGVIHTVSPQIFYSFYRLIFPNLPNQWVIDAIWDADGLRAVATLAEGGTLADHLAGIVLWAIVPFTGWLHLRHWWRG
jgi:hypothetical protein